jgi:hypothetical protein
MWRLMIDACALRGRVREKRTNCELSIVKLYDVRADNTNPQLSCHRVVDGLRDKLRLHALTLAGVDQHHHLLAAIASK